MDSSDLVSLDVLGTDEELRAASRAEAAGRSGGDFDDEAEGRDESRAVTVRIDRAGRVSDVLISTWWRDDLSPSGLGAALLAAYRSALTRAAAAVGDRIPDAAGARAWPVGYAGPTEMIDDDAAWLEDVRHRLDRVQDNLDRVDRLRRDGPIERTVSGPAGYVQVTVRGEVVSQVQVDAHAAMRESANRLAADALDAFRAVR